MNTDDANLEAQSKGKVASLCDSDSAFQNYSQECKCCITSNGGDATAIDGPLTQYLHYCEDLDVTNTSIDVTWLAPYATVISTTTSSSLRSGESYTYTDESYSYIYTTAFSTRSEYFFHLSVRSIVSSYIPSSMFSQLVCSVRLSAGAASVTGDATSLFYAALEATSVPSWFSAAVPATYSSQMYTVQEEINQFRATPISLAPVPTSSPTSSNPETQTSLASSDPSTGEQFSRLNSTEISGLI